MQEDYNVVRRLFGDIVKWVASFIICLIMCEGCVYEREDPLPQNTASPDLDMNFETSYEPLFYPEYREPDATNTGNGCLSGPRWNLYYWYNLCIAPTVAIDDAVIDTTSQVARVGSKSCRFYLRATPLDKWPIGSATHRAELSPDRNAPYNRYPGQYQDRWYALSIYIPSDFIFTPEAKSNDLRFMVAQWQHGSEGSPICALEISGRYLQLARTRGASTDHVLLPRERLHTIVAGEWIDLVVNIRWSKSDGKICIWVNDDLRYKKENIQTIYHDLLHGGGFKFGIYYWRWLNKESVSESLSLGIDHREIFIDEVKEYIGENGYSVVSLYP